MFKLKVKVVDMQFLISFSNQNIYKGDYLVIYALTTGNKPAWIQALVIEHYSSI